MRKGPCLLFLISTVCVATTVPWQETVTVFTNATEASVPSFTNETEPPVTLSAPAVTTYPVTRYDLLALFINATEASVPSLTNETEPPETLSASTAVTAYPVPPRHDPLTLPTNATESTMPSLADETESMTTLSASTAVTDYLVPWDETLILSIAPLVNETEPMPPFIDAEEKVLNSTLGAMQACTEEIRTLLLRAYKTRSPLFIGLCMAGGMLCALTTIGVILWLVRTRNERIVRNPVKYTLQSQI